MFNPQELHSLSLQCHKCDNDVYLISSYLKTQVVGLNDNSNMVIKLPLNDQILIWQN